MCSYSICHSFLPPSPTKKKNPHNVRCGHCYQYLLFMNITEQLSDAMCAYENITSFYFHQLFWVAKSIISNEYNSNKKRYIHMHTRYKNAYHNEFLFFFFFHSYVGSLVHLVHTLDMVWQCMWTYSKRHMFLQYFHLSLSGFWRMKYFLVCIIDSNLWISIGILHHFHHVHFSRNIK